MMVKLKFIMSYHVLIFFVLFDYFKETSHYRISVPFSDISYISNKII